MNCYIKILFIFALLITQSYAKQNILINRIPVRVETTLLGLCCEYHVNWNPYNNMTTALVPYSKKINLNKAKKGIYYYVDIYTLVPYWWYEWLSQFNWHIRISKNSFYAKRQVKGRSIYIHKVISETVNTRIIIDHKNMNGLDNTYRNIRFATTSQNAANIKPRGVSKFLGVSVTKSRNNTSKWRSSIKINGKSKTLGCYVFTPEGEISAALAYDVAAKEKYGEFANLNFK